MRIPAKYLRGSSPLKAGFIESMKVSEKYVICISEIISSAITRPVLKRIDASRAKAAKVISV